MSDWVKKARPSHMLLIRNQFKYKNINRLKVRAWKKCTRLALFFVKFFYFNPGIMNIKCTMLTLIKGKILQWID